MTGHPLDRAGAQLLLHPQVVGQLLDLETTHGLEYKDFLSVMRTADSGNSQKIMEAFQVRVPDSGNKWSRKLDVGNIAVQCTVYSNVYSVPCTESYTIRPDG